MEVTMHQMFSLEMCDIHEYEYYRDINDGDMI